MSHWFVFRQTGMVMVVNTITTALFKLGVTTSVPSLQQLEHYVTQVFTIADVNKDERVRHSGCGGCGGCGARDWLAAAGVPIHSLVSTHL